jgi:cyclic beta-1,2-glucan synthetase
VAFTTLVATTRERVFELAGRYHDPYAAQRALDLAWTSTQVELRELDITPADAAIFQELAGNLLYSSPLLRVGPEELRRNHGSQPMLWSQAVSGDWPIVLATVDTAEGLPTLRQLFAAHRYWRRRGMKVDLVVLNEHGPSYLQELHEKINATMFTASDSAIIDQPGGVFVRRRDQIGTDELLMLRATARLVVECDGRSIGKIVDAASDTLAPAPNDDEYVPSLPRASGRLTPPVAARRIRVRTPAGLPVVATTSSPRPRTIDTSSDGLQSGTAAPTTLHFDNGFGGVTPEGDYEIHVRGDHVPPAPWCNVIANQRGGFLVSERGASCTWAENSQFYRLTPWHNDPVSDSSSDAIYLRDEDSGDAWSATPAPMRSDVPYTVRHSPGRSSFTHECGHIVTHLTMSVPKDAPVKLSILRVTNHDDRPRRIAVTSYVEWTLGTLREHTQHQVHTTFDPETEAVFAQNFFNPQYASWVAFAALSEPIACYTADRREFLGRNGTPASPVGLDAELTGETGVGNDPCAALRCRLELAPGETRELAIVLGAGASADEAKRLLAEHRTIELATAAMRDTIDDWNRRLSVITVRTPEPSFDVMLNRWSLYQALACRMWGRTALYQSSGAYGFRDQLQDCMAFVYADQDVAREHVLRAASRQFVEGDVQHWWHPDSGRGVRTRFSDDLAFLPYVVDHYLRVTSDHTVLDEVVPFLTMRALEPQEHELYDVPQISSETASLYEHCARALRKACTTGAHGLPLIGIGDWNDGMNRVGIEGKGESVWLAWFLIATLRAFAVHAEARGEATDAADFRQRADAYAAAVEAHAWDGAWYRRAYFDDGTPLGSAESDECKIDAIAQSWSVISDASQPERRRQAMRSFEEHLVREDVRLLMLLTPPFDKTPNDPGYIKGYLPGVRENGAQYTHAALWSVLATALGGDGSRAFELFQMLNPITHSATPEDVAVYKVEPYVVAADVYTAQGQLGRGGWTWYTGSASWMYRVGVEAILGFHLRGDTLFIEPSAPAAWREYTIEYRHGTAMYIITVLRPGAVRAGGASVTLDGRVLDGTGIPLADDGARHTVEVRPA